MDTYPYSLLSFDVFFPGDTRPDSVARAGTLTYIHTYVSKPMSTTVDRAIASFVRRRLGLATGRPDLIFLKLRSLGHSAVGLRCCPTFRSCFYTLTLHIIGRTIGPVALLCAVVSVPSSRSNQIATVVVRANARQMLLAER